MRDKLFRKSLVIGIIILLLGTVVVPVISENVGIVSNNSFSINAEMLLISDEPCWQWAKSAGGTSYDKGNSVAVHASGNNYIIGTFRDTATFGSTTLTSQGGYDVFVAKLSTNGAWQWAKSAGGSSDDRGRGVAVDTSGNTYITGYFHGTATFGSTTLTSQGPPPDVFVAKLSTNGAWQWAKSAGGPNYDIGADVAVDASGNTYITGYFESTAYGDVR
jgi:hypothetical protein